MLIKMSFKGLIDVLEYSTLLKSHKKSEYLFWWKWGLQILPISARPVGVTKLLPEIALNPIFSKTKKVTENLNTSLQRA